MSLDFNKQAARYDFLAVRSAREDYDTLSDRPFGLLKQLRSMLGAEYSKVDESRQRVLLDAAGCLDRLRAFCLQVRRVANHAQGLTQNRLPDQPDGLMLGPGEMIVLAADEACFDFESLLFHARAALDRVTLFVSRRHGQKSDRFSKLRRTLGNFASRDPCAKQMIAILDAAPQIRGLLTDEDGSTALRSLVAHRCSVPEGRQIAFTIHLLGGNRRLIFDCEALGRPLLASAEQLNRDVPFVVLNGVAIYMGLTALPRDDFVRTWQNPTCVFSDFVDDSGQGPRFSVGSMNPDGFIVKRRSLRPSVCDQSIDEAGR